MGQQFNESSNVLPEDFDGDFWFSNPDDEEFIGKWGSKEYHYAPQTRSKMVIMGAAPEEVQNIRKKFAKDLGVKMFFKSPQGKKMKAIETNNVGEPVFRSFKQANSYNDTDLKPFIQACLDPLPHARAVIMNAPKDNIEEKLHKDEDGELMTRAVKQRDSLKEKVFNDHAPTTA